MKPQEYQTRIDELTERLRESESMLEAIRSGEVEALIVRGKDGEQIFRLEGADHSYRLFVEVMSEGAVTVNREGIILYCNKRFCDMAQISIEEVIGTSFQEFLPRGERPLFAKLLSAAQELTSKHDFILKRADDSSLPVRLAIAPFLGQDHHKSVCMVVMDMSAQKLAEERLTALSRRLLDVQENERRHLARELHDEIGQFLTGLKIVLETTSLMDKQMQSDSMLEASQQVAALLKRIQDISLDLRPPMLDDLGLLPTALWHLQRYKSQTPINIHFNHRGLSEKRFAPQLETTAYRIIQEALTNIARHSKAKTVQIRAVADGENITLDVEDNGIGFDVEKALQSRNSSGLTGMQERAALLGGELIFDSSIGKGTRIRAKLPIKVANEL
ncbi:MAG: ATP-binding protein [Verrucomicrobiales bacterium]